MVGATLFDFSADFIEGPIRAYAMDVCNEEDVKTCFLCQAIFTGTFCFQQFLLLSFLGISVNKSVVKNNGDT